MKHKRFMAFFMALIVFILHGVSVLASAEQHSQEIYEVNRNSNVSKAFLKKEERANEVYNALLESFRMAKNQEAYVRDNDLYQYTVEGLVAGDFPKYYCGAYINVYGDLVVRVSEESLKQRNFDIKNESSVLSEAENIYYQASKYSYAELIDTMSSIYTYCLSDEYINSGFEIKGYEIRDDLNCVVVYIDSIDEDVVSEVKKHVIQETIVFELKKEDDKNAYSIKCGVGIGKTATLTFSAGYRAKYINSSGKVVNGIITCAHAFSSSPDGQAVYCASGQIGTLDKSKYQLSGKVDAAFIELSGSEMTNAVEGTSRTVSKTNVITKATGGVVYKRGISTYNTTGTVLSASYTSTGNGIVTLTDQVKASNACSPGDSGGIVYAELTEGTSVYYVTGITSRYIIDSGETVYCKAQNINPALGVSIR